MHPPCCVICGFTFLGHLPTLARSQLSVDSEISFILPPFSFSLSSFCCRGHEHYRIDNLCNAGIGGHASHQHNFQSIYYIQIKILSLFSFRSPRRNLPEYWRETKKRTNKNSSSNCDQKCWSDNVTNSQVNTSSIAVLQPVAPLATLLANKLFYYYYCHLHVQATFTLLVIHLLLSRSRRNAVQSSGDFNRVAGSTSRQAIFVEPDDLELLRRHVASQSAITAKRISKLYFRHLPVLTPVDAESNRESRVGLMIITHPCSITR